MIVFLLCGIALLFFAYKRFTKRIFYPSVIFCLMWGLNCIYHFLIYQGIVNPLVSAEEYKYSYMDTYIIYFTIATMFGFFIAHVRNGNKGVNLVVSVEILTSILQKYKWIMWLNFWGGILRIFVMIQLVGFDFHNIIDYRLAANAVMMGSGNGVVALVFKITAYIIMLANLYVAMAGLKGGLGQITVKDVLVLFILYMPSQMATGGRLFILYFVIFFFGSFLLGRGVAMFKSGKKWLYGTEKRAIINMMLIMIPLVVAISAVRSDGGTENLSSDIHLSALDAFSYITDGTMTTDKCMEYFGGENLGVSSFGNTTFVGNSDRFLEFLSYKHNTIYASSVFTIIASLYMDYGYWGSIIIWAILAFLIESIACACLNKLSIMRFLVYVMLLKVCYESIISGSIAANIPMYELLILLALLYNPIFGKYEKT